MKVGLVAIGFLVPLVVTGPYQRHLVVNAAILGIFGLGVAFLIRRLGMVSLGHALYFGGAAYAFGAFSTHGGLDIVPALLLALGGVVAVALAVGSLLVRSRGIAFTMLTLAFGQFVFTLAGLTQTRSVTGGDDGLPVRMNGTLLGLTVRDFSNPTTMWTICWAVVTVVLLALGLIGRSRFGKLLEAIRENEERVRFNGSNTYLPVLVAYVVSALVAGIAGVLFALYNSFLSLDVLAWTTSGNALIVSFIGGCWTATGPLWGALIYTVGNAMLVSGGRNEWQLYVGVAVIVVMVFAKAGVVGSLQAQWVRRRERRQPPVDLVRTS
ncbi:branched-chain amino acid ABC transporter permease [Rhizomonospora bruguierae]|uniref:branched-chain amino acid ABC transporter permease n=1 Tax=Rhizomonospora bruguierae TaxID=1581705 RepID=UPI001BCDCAEE|nr:branched-chain amino acid ABC transporter permease [Micromonospora sp. NBRC 107566]